MKSKLLFSLGAATLLAAGSTASGVTLLFGIGVRETGTTAAIGANGGGATGGIEWADRGVHAVTDSGAWQTVSIDLSTADIQAFAGATADGTLAADNNKGVLESLRIDIVDSAGPFLIYLDNLTYTDGAGTTVITGWEGYSAGTEVAFRQPSFSGSTSPFLVAGGTSGVVVGGAGNGSDGAYLVNFEFIDTTATNWLRLTTSNTANIPNPTIGLDGVVSFDVRIAPVPEPASLGLAAIGAALAFRRRR